MTGSPFYRLVAMCVLALCASERPPDPEPVRPRDPSLPTFEVKRKPGYKKPEGCTVNMYDKGVGAHTWKKMLLRELPKQCNTNRLADIKTLWLTRNEITSMKAKDFKGMTGLERLYLGSNKIKTLAHGQFKYLTSLKELYINLNRIKELEYGAFEGLGKLEVLDMSYSGIGEIEEGAFEGMGELKKLSFGYCGVKELPSELFRDTPNLRELTMNDNPIKAVPRDIFDGLHFNKLEVGSHMKHSECTKDCVMAKVKGKLKRTYTACDDKPDNCVSSICEHPTDVECLICEDGYELEDGECELKEPECGDDEDDAQCLAD